MPCCAVYKEDIRWKKNHCLCVSLDIVRSVKPAQVRTHLGKDRNYMKIWVCRYLGKRIWTEETASTKADVQGEQRDPYDCKGNE